jgi:Carboxypeptidase regulatory-like domain
LHQLSIASRGVLLLLSMCMIFPLQAQVTTAEIVGTVTDGNGAVVPGASIAVTSDETGIAHSTVSNASGEFVVPLLPIGQYAASVESNGFKTWKANQIVLSAGDHLRLTAVLELGAVHEQVEVTAQTPALQTDTSSLGNLVNSHAVEDLPLNGRNFMQLVQATAGASPGFQNGTPSGNRPDDRRLTSQASINGQPDNYNNQLLDGMDNNDAMVGTIIVKPSVDALQEIKIVTNVYGSDLGHTAGGVINLVTKSGTNTLRGSAYEFLRNQSLDAKNFFAPAGPITPFHQNQFGASLGGRIRKDRTFFFADYEGFRQTQSQVWVDTVPTPQERSGDFSAIGPIFDPLTTRPNPNNPGQYIRTAFAGKAIPASRIDPVSLAILGLYPLPQRPGLTNNFTYTPIRTQDADTFDTRIDHNLSERDAFYARYSFNNTTTLTPGALPAVNGVEPGGDASVYPGNTSQRAQNVHLNYVHTFSSNLVFEGKAGFSRLAISTLPLNFGKSVSEQYGIPGVNIDPDSSGLTLINIAGLNNLGGGTSLPLYTIDNVFQYMGNLSYTPGKHTLQAGVSFSRRQLTPFQSPNSRGTFSFDGNFTNDPSGATAQSGNAVASFLLGYPASTTRTKYLVWPGLRFVEASAYIQDDWRVRPWLTLNLGVRYDLSPPFSEVDNRISNLNLATGQVLVAGQNGVSSTSGIPTNWHNFAPRIGFAATVLPRTVIRGGFGISYISYATNVGAGLTLHNPPFVSLYTVSPTPLTPINTIDQGFPAPTPTSTSTGGLSPVSLDLKTPYVEQYNLTLQREAAGFVFSASYVGALSRNQFMSPNVNLALPGPGAVDPRRVYHSVLPSASSINLTESAGTADYQALQITVEHRFKRGLSLLSSYTWSHNIDDYQRPAGGDPGSGPWPQLVNDLHLEVANSDLDVRHRWTSMANYELPFGKSLKGFVGVIGKGWQVNGILTVQTGLPLTIYNAAPRANTGGGDRPNLVGVPYLSDPTINEWFNTAAFAAQPLFTIGNVGRNTIFGPGLKNLDFSLFKNFALTEKYTLQFRAESFNLTNTPNFAPPNGGFGTPAFGQISSTGNYISREIQFALKLAF